MKKNTVKRAGRPEGQTNLANRILDAAELLFAEQGYSGTTLRQVAEELGVNPAMAAYYFRNKENLFREVFLRRGLDVAKQRLDRLETLTAQGGFGIEDLVRAFLAPSAELRGSAQGRAFLRLHARLHMEPEPFSFALRSEVYDESTRAYVAAFATLLPDRPPEHLYQKMSLLVGAYLYAFSDTNRLSDLVGVDEARAVTDLYETTIAFCVAGMTS